MSNQASYRSFAPAILAFSALLFLVSCGGEGSTTSAPPPPTLQSISVSPQTATVAAGLTQQFTATGNYSDGSSRTLNAPTWSTSDNTIATVNSAGLATTLKAGTVTIAAASGTISNTAPLVVDPPIPVSLSIVPSNSSVTIGLTTPTKLSAILAYSDSSSMDVSTTATWSVANPFTASVDTTGNVTALRMGYATVSAASGTFSASSAFVVTGQPRYLYFISGGGGQLVSKAIVDSASGQLHMTGYIPTGANNNATIPCSTSDPLNKFLYVGSSVNNGAVFGEIQIYNLDPANGALTPLTGSPFPQTSAVGCIDFEPAGKFAYAVNPNIGATGLLTFSADPVSGALTLLTSANLTGSPTRAAVDPIGKYLYLAAFSSDDSTASALGFSIDSSTGALTPIAGTPFALTNVAGTFSFHPSGNFLYMANTFSAGAGAGPIAIDPSGLLVYVANQIDNSISAYQYWGTSPELFESKGQFVLPYTDGSPFSVGASPLKLAIDPNEAFLYVLCSDQTLRAFAIDYSSGGHIAQVTSVPLPGSPSGLSVEPKGQFVYTSDSTGVSAFSVNATSGALSPVTLNPASTLANITGIYAEPAGQYLYVTTGAQNVPGAVYAYSIGSTGNLTTVSSQPVATPVLPSSMAFGDDIR
jgi:6-phosphogluconolactonase